MTRLAVRRRCPTAVAPGHPLPPGLLAARANVADRRRGATVLAWGRAVHRSCAIAPLRSPLPPDPAPAKPRHRTPPRPGISLPWSHGAAWPPRRGLSGHRYPVARGTGNRTSPARRRGPGRAPCGRGEGRRRRVRPHPIPPILRVRPPSWVHPRQRRRRGRPMTRREPPPSGPNRSTGPARSGERPPAVSREAPTPDQIGRAITEALREARLLGPAEIADTLVGDRAGTAVTGTPVPGHAVVRAGEPRTDPQAGAFAGPTASPPQMHVHIDRVQVERAPPPEPGAPAPAAPARPSRLAAYLNGRDER